MGWWNTYNPAPITVRAMSFNAKMVEADGTLAGPGKALVSVNNQAVQFTGYTGEAVPCGYGEALITEAPLAAAELVKVPDELLGAPLAVICLVAMACVYAI